MNLELRPLSSNDEAAQCARLMVSSDPWITLKRSFDDALQFFGNESLERFVASAGSRFAGFLVINMRGAFIGYIQAICVAPEFRGRGIGSALLQFAEERVFRESPNLFLCVSSFNHEVRAWYARLGFEVIGELKDYVIKGHSEYLHRKTRGPKSGFKVKKEPFPYPWNISL